MRQKQGVFSLFLLSPSSRRAWIEILPITNTGRIASGVALLAEGVDRNIPADCGVDKTDKVALLAEGVDRNNLPCTSDRV